MRKLIAGIVVVASLVGCGQPESKHEIEGRQKSAAPLVSSDLVGRWQFVLTDEVRDKLRARLATKIADPAALDSAMKDAETEARASELEFTKEGVFVSRVLGEELVRDPFASRVAPPDTVSLQHGEKTMDVVFVDHDTISLYEPSKGHLIYTRVK